MEEKSSQHRSHRKRRGQVDPGKPRLVKKVESVIVSRLMRILGILFILAALFYAVTSADKLITIAKNLNSSEKVLAAPSAGVQIQSGNIASEQGPGGIFYLLAGVTLLTALVFLELSRRFRWRKIPRLLLILFYAAILLLAKQFGWQIHVLFPMVMTFSLMLYRNGTSLHSTLAIKINVLLAWIIFLLWFVLQIIFSADGSRVLPFFIYASLMFLLFLGSGVFHGFIGHHKYSSFTEIFTATANIFIYLLMCAIVMIKYGMEAYLWILPLVIGLFLSSLLFITDRTRFTYNRIPYLYAVMVTFSLVLPLLLPSNFLLLFFAAFSVFLLVYARYSRNQTAILLSIFSMTAMLLIYLYFWVFQFGPAAVTGEITVNHPLYYKGLIASLVSALAFLANILLLKGVEVTLSKDWFNKKSYLRIFKGIVLLVIYLGGFWILYYPPMVWLSNEMARYLVWFSYSCLYFIVAIPILDHQKSSYLRPLFWFSMFITAAYPLFVHIFVVEMRNGFLTHASISPIPFWFHYLAVLLLVVNLIVSGRSIPQLFKENKLLVQGFWVYFILLGLFLLLSEFDHLMIITQLKRGVRIEDIAAADKLLPYTIILLVSAIGILIAGLVSRSRFFRTLALILLSVTLVKILYKDLPSLDGTGKVILLFILGVFVLVVSFFYSKIKGFFSSRSTHSHHHHAHHRPHRNP